MNTRGTISTRNRKPGMTPAHLMRLAGLSALIAGLCAAGLGLLHPVNEPASVTTAAWISSHILAIGMCFFGLFGLAGLYARQAERAGWVGLAGFILYSLWFGLVLPFSFIEAFILPLLADESPAFVAGFLGMFTGIPSQVDLGLLPTFWNISGPMYILGPLLFGIASFRAGILPRWAGALLAAGALLTPAGALLPTELEPKIMIPVGLGLAWLGYALFSERQANTAPALLDQRGAQPEAGKAG